MWPSFLHHISIHFPIVLSFVLAAVGAYSLVRDTEELRRVLWFGGWALCLMTTVAVVSGLWSAPGLLLGQGSSELLHHRDLGLTVWVVVGLACWSYHQGMRGGHRDFRRWAVALWWVASLGVIGAGHWGGSQLHPEALPF